MAADVRSRQNPTPTIARLGMPLRGHWTSNDGVAQNMNAVAQRQQLRLHMIARRALLIGRRHGPARKWFGVAHTSVLLVRERRRRSLQPRPCRHLQIWIARPAVRHRLGLERSRSIVARSLAAVVRHGGRSQRRHCSLRLSCQPGHPIQGRPMPVEPGAMRPRTPCPTIAARTWRLGGSPGLPRRRHGVARQGTSVAELHRRLR
mmetsp:Transcript_68641/g.147015  ORF Transcript_68641/g.147015 Transcript_68641/m.147015 type:complete len:204 (+) Transcript_68641:504-1115(+)